jgi:polyhydroxyalkanoate synthesis regulator protein
VNEQHAVIVRDAKTGEDITSAILGSTMGDI